MAQIIFDDDRSIQSHKDKSVINTHILPSMNDTTYLGLSFNLLETNDVCSQIWKYSTRLKFLNLRNNVIYSISAGCFGYLRSLKSLFLDMNKISFIEESGTNFEP